MAASTRTPEAEGLDVVIVGAFNPAILHPEWFLHQGLIEEEDAAKAEVNVVSTEATDVQFAGLQFICVSDRLTVSTSNISHASRMQDLLLQIFSLLGHIPVKACGINAWVHYSVTDVEYWHKVGNILAPKDLIWRDVLEQPGMQSLTVKSPRAGEFAGEMNITVEPSRKFHPGIFVRSNYHYSVPADKLHSGSANQLIAFWKSDWERALEGARRVSEKIFEKI